MRLYCTRRLKSAARRLMSVAAHVTLAASLPVLATTGCGGPTHEQGPRNYPSQIEELAVRRERHDPLAESQTAGRKVYDHYCQICHGAEGQGDGFNSTNMAVSPRDFTDAKFWKTAADKRMTSAVSQGGESVGKSVLMPAWGRTLSEQQIRDVIAFLHAIPERAKKAEATSESAPSD